MKILINLAIFIVLFFTILPFITTILAALIVTVAILVLLEEVKWQVMRRQAKRNIKCKCNIE